MWVQHNIGIPTQRDCKKGKNERLIVLTNVNIEQNARRIHIALF